MLKCNLTKGEAVIKPANPDNKVYAKPIGELVSAGFPAAACAARGSKHGAPGRRRDSTSASRRCGGEAWANADGAGHAPGRGDWRR